jgi:hypothetical protein
VDKLSGRPTQDYGPGSEKIVEPQEPAALRGFLTFPALCALLPDVTSAGLVLITERDARESGPPMDSRLARMRAIAGEIVEAEASLTQLADASSAEGVSGVPLPDGERAARTRRADALARWAKDEALTKAARGNLPHSPLPEPK